MKFLLAILFFSCFGSGYGQGIAIEKIVRRANIVYDSSSFQTGIPLIPLLVSNGITGACFDPMGFQSTPNTGYPQGRTVFGYIRNYDEAKDTRQIQFPLAVIEAEFADGNQVLDLMNTKNYNQELDLYTATLNTSFNLFGETNICEFAHQTIPNLFIIKINRKAQTPDKELVIKFNCETSQCQNNDFLWHVDPIKLKFEPLDKSTLNIRSQTDLTITQWTIKTNNEITTSGNYVYIKIKEQESIIKIFIERDDCPTLNEVINKPYSELLDSHTEEWAKVWATSWVNYPDPIAQNLWTRMKYYMISHFPLISEKPMIPSGLNSNIWGFTFPQDVYFVEESLPRLGHFDRCEKALKYWLDILPEVKKYSKKTLGVDGGFYPWTPPYQDWDKYERNGVVGEDSYELHNPAYVLAMIWHYYQISQNFEFLGKNFPVIEEVFRFYANISTINNEGKFDIFHKHGTGQDEASNKDGNIRNFLCSSYSAEYSCNVYMQACEMIEKYDKELFKKAKVIAEKGYERNKLLRKDGWYTTYEGDDRENGNQKHPVQLNPISFLPMANLVTENSPVYKAWENRYSLTYKANMPMTLGWTIGDFALSSCRMRSPGNLVKDLSAIQPCHAADPRWIQFYESSYWPGWHESKAYYFPMMALYLQTFTDVVVQDWRNYVDIFACILPDWENKDFEFHGINTKGGSIVSGWWKKGKFEITIDPGAAKKISLMVSREIEKIYIIGNKDGLKSFKGKQLVNLQFDGKNKLILKN